MSKSRTSPARLYLNKRNKKVLGVCAGVADYFGISPLPLRIGALIGLFAFTAPTLVFYFLAAYVLEEKPEDLYEDKAEEKFWQQVRTEPKGTTRDIRHKLRGIETRLRSMEAHVTSTEFELNKKFRGLDD